MRSKIYFNMGCGEVWAWVVQIISSFWLSCGKNFMYWIGDGKIQHKEDLSENSIRFYVRYRGRKSKPRKKNKNFVLKKYFSGNYYSVFIE